jgi:hypothetical protein
VTFLSVAMGALLGADTLSGEIISGTIQTIVTKPVRRSDVVLGGGLQSCWRSIHVDVRRRCQRMDPIDISPKCIAGVLVDLF